MKFFSRDVELGSICRLQGFYRFNIATADFGASASLPSAGQSGIGAAGAAGQPGAGQADEPVRTGATEDARKTSGVSGQDLTQDGLPPA
jgi:hypothetical protein